MVDEFQKSNFPFFSNLFSEVPNNVIDDVEMKKGCIDIAKKYYIENIPSKFENAGLEGRLEIANTIYNDIKSQMGIDAELVFDDMPPHKLGGYNEFTNHIRLNRSYLESSSPDELVNTLFHESRHAFQNKCISHPESVSVKQNIIDVWKDNCDNYISPEYDFEAYENQEIEKDANYFADSVMKKGADLNYA